MLLAAQFGDPRDPRVVPGAVAIELTHLATLYHDDVMDEAAIRRGHQSANSRWSNTVAILTGDFLFARASRSWPTWARGDPDPGRDVRPPGDRPGGRDHRPGPGQDPLDHYMGVVTNKTGSLIATSGRFGAMLSGAPDEVTARITPACEALGIAFQLSDDIIDVASDSEQLGQDARHRPARGSADAADAARAAFGRPGRMAAWPSCCARASSPIPRLHAEALALLRAHPAMEAARADLRDWAERPAATSWRCRTSRRGRPSRRSATSWWSAPADRRSRIRPAARVRLRRVRARRARGRRRSREPAGLNRALAS